MVFKHIFYHLDWRTDIWPSQVTAIETFFQDHAVEWWEIPPETEIMFGVYEEAPYQVRNKPRERYEVTQFMFYDTGPLGIEGNIAGLNADATIANFVNNNRIIKVRVIEDRFLAIQYEPR